MEAKQDKKNAAAASPDASSITGLRLRGSSLRGSSHLDRLLNAVRLGRVDLLARLGNLFEDRLVGEVGDDLGRLVLEGDFVVVDAWAGTRELASSWEGGFWG